MALPQGACYRAFDIDGGLIEVTNRFLARVHPGSSAECRDVLADDAPLRADVVLLLHRQDYYHRGERDYVSTNEAELVIAKQRNGPTGTVKLTFCPESALSENYVPLPA